MALVPQTPLSAQRGAGQPWESPPSTQPCHSAELQELGQRCPDLPSQPEMTPRLAEGHWEFAGSPEGWFPSDESSWVRWSQLHNLLNGAELAGWGFVSHFSKRGKCSHCAMKTGTRGTHGTEGRVPPPWETSQHLAKQLLLPPNLHRRVNLKPTPHTAASEPLLEGDRHLDQEEHRPTLQ